MNRSGVSLFKRKWLWGYLLLLVCSAALQLVWSGQPQLAPQDRITELAPQTASGSVEGEPIRLAYCTVGSGDSVLLLHGSPGAIADYQHLEPALAARFRLLIPDLPGFGRSSRWLPDYSIRAHARYVLAFMDQQQVERVHVLGFSMGSGVALCMADLAPERVATLTLCGGIGIQEGEGSGDYYCEHLKYAVGYAGLVVGPELVPHFGLLGSRSFRHTFIRNFWDTDQRPLRHCLSQLRQPVLILHGRHDPLVPAWVAEEHHRIVPQSELVMFDDSHFMLLSLEGSKRLADEVVPFLERHRDPSTPPQPRTVDHSAGRLPGPFPDVVSNNPSLGPWLQMGAIVLGTFASEDLTSVSVGLLIRAGQVDWFVGLFACFLGIFVGDLGLWLFGRILGRGLLRWGWLHRRLSSSRLEDLGLWFDRRAGWAILASRFLPGTRLPLYLAAGALGRKGGRFALWTALAALLWTPLVVIGSAIFGEAVATPIAPLFGPGWFALIVSVIILFGIIRVATLACTATGRGKLIARVSRLWRWEFWPNWLFYLPVLPWLAYLSLRYRGVLTWTAANPGIPQGGVVGESKYAILAQLPEEWVVPSTLVPPGELGSRLARVRQVIEQQGWGFPLILKPDAAQRGAGVKRVRDLVDVEKYLQGQPAAIVVQTYHPGPYEAGIFYYRLPDEETGHIFSVTDKVFPVVVGDGRFTLEQLIWRHPRYRMQARTFLTRHDQERGRILAEGEPFVLALAGNHCQGTMFRDGANLITPELERSVDKIARQFPGFFIGRFDVRYTDTEAFKAGRDLAIVELNGVTSESTNIYDPSWSLLAAYRTLFRQWSLLYRIGYANRQRGYASTGILALLGLVFDYYRGLRVDPLAD